VVQIEAFSFEFVRVYSTLCCYQRAASNFIIRSALVSFYSHYDSAQKNFSSMTLRDDERFAHTPSVLCRALTVNV
jgi:hypothetical protein